MQRERKRMRGLRDCERRSNVDVLGNLESVDNAKRI